MARTGRPSKITDELIAEAWEYIDSCNNIGTHVLLPTVERLAITINVSRDTLYEWAKTNDDFSDILGRLGELQADKLMQNSLLNRYNPTISKLLLSKHGYIEQSAKDITSNGETVTFINDMPRPPKKD